MMDVSGLNFVVVGAGQSGQAAASLLASRGAKVSLNDMKSRDDFGGALDHLTNEGVDLVLGSHPPELFSGADHIVLSPGVPPLAAVSSAESQGVKVHSEVELASWYLQGDIVAITGTNGKSTVTTMVATILESAGKEVFAGGNLGTPLVDAVGTAAGESGGVVVAELSSFQLERVSSFRAKVGVLLNVSPDHLDRYES